MHEAILFSHVVHMVHHGRVFLEPLDCVIGDDVIHHSPQRLVDVMPLSSDGVTDQVLAQPLLERFQLGFRVCLEIHPTGPVWSIANLPPGPNPWDFAKNTPKVFEPVRPRERRG